MSTTQTPSPTYVALADRIKAGKLSDANIQILREALDAVAPATPKSLDDIGAEMARKFGREVQLKRGLRPTYLDGCKGHLGNLRGTKWEFYPEPGTRAYERSNGRAWRIPASCFDEASKLQIEGELEMIAEGRIS